MKPKNTLFLIFTFLFSSVCPAISQEAPNENIIKYIEQYAALAWMYEKYVLTGNGQPIAELSKYMNSDRPTISTRVAEARNRGLLSKPKHGTFGGQLTAKGKKALGFDIKQPTKGKKK